MSTHNLGYYEEISQKSSLNYHQISSNTHFICSSGMLGEFLLMKKGLPTLLNHEIHINLQCFNNIFRMFSQYLFVIVFVFVCLTSRSTIFHQYFMFLVSQGIGIYTLVQPCCTSRLLWRRGRVSDCHPGDLDSIPIRVRYEDIFLRLSHLLNLLQNSC